MATTFSPGETITISYTSKGYAVTVATAKSKKAKAKTKYYSNLSLLLDETDGAISTVKNGDAISLLNLSTSKKKEKQTISSYYDSIRPYKETVLYQAEFPGYKNAYLEFVNLSTGKTKVVGFMVSPNSVAHSYSTAQQVSKTMGGWFVLRSGSNLQTINLTGYMLDTLHCQERHDFVEKYYKTYIEDKKNANNEYINNWSVNLIIEGKKYIGFFQSLNLQKSSVQPFLYQYGISFVAVNEVMVYQSSEAALNRRAMKSEAYNEYSSTGEIVTTVGDKTSELLTS